MAETQHALSVKQPWATLLAHGLKTIEIRRWAPHRTGRILIHAGRTADKRSQAWDRLPESLHSLAQLRGGIVGVGTLQSHRLYLSAEEFAQDQALHLNELSWFETGLHGFVFEHLAPLPFIPCPGWVRFFSVKNVTL